MASMSAETTLSITRLITRARLLLFSFMVNSFFPVSELSDDIRHLRLFDACPDWRLAGLESASEQLAMEMTPIRYPNSPFR
jgi:hypothetical protein